MGVSPRAGRRPRQVVVGLRSGGLMHVAASAADGTAGGLSSAVEAALPDSMVLRQVRLCPRLRGRLLRPPVGSRTAWSSAILASRGTETFFLRAPGAIVPALSLLLLCSG